MASKVDPNNILGGGTIDFTKFHFHNPELQRLVNEWFSPAALAAASAARAAKHPGPNSPINIRPKKYLPPGWTRDSKGITRNSAGDIIDYNGMSQSQYERQQHSQGEHAAGTSGIPNYDRTVSKATQSMLKRAKKAGLTQAGSSIGSNVGGRGASVNAKNITDEIAKNNARLTALGQSPVGAHKHGHSLFGRVMDVLSRGNYGAAEGLKRAFDTGATSKSWNPLPAFENFGKGFAAGVSGKKKTVFSADIQHIADVHHALTHGRSADQAKLGEGHVNSVLRGVGGLAGDILLDPTTYMGVGLIPKAGKAAKLAAEAGAHLDQGAALIKTGKKASVLDAPTKELLTGGRYAGGKIGQDAAKAQKAQILDPLSQMREGIIKGKKAELYAGPGTMKEATRLATEHGDAWYAQALKNYENVANTEIKKGLGIGLAGKNGPKITVVPGNIISKIAAVKKADPVAKSLTSFEKHLKASAGTFPEMHNIRLSTIGRGFARSHFLLNHLRNTFKSAPADLRQETWSHVLAGVNTPSGHLIQIPHAGNKAIDMHDVMSQRLASLEQRVSGLATGDPPMTWKELNQGLPPGLKDKFKGFKGKQANNWLRESMKTWSTKDGAKALWLAESAYERAASKRAMLASLADTFGVRTKGAGALHAADAAWNNLARDGWKEVNPKMTHGVLDGVKFDPNTADGIEKILTAMDHEREWGKITKTLSRFNAPMKFLYTMPNPGFHIRNALGDIFINMLDNVSMASYRQSAKVMYKNADKYGGVSPLIMQEGDILQNAYRGSPSRVLFNMDHAISKQKLVGGKIHNVKEKAVTEREIFAGMNKYGIRQNYALAEYGALENVGQFKRGMQNTRGAIVTASEYREDYFRLAHFIDLVKKNPSKAHTLDDNMAYAAQQIRKMHFDYTDFTKTEKQVLSNVIPFYKWTRKALPLMAEIMFTHPGKAIVPTKAQRNISSMLGNDPTANDPFPNASGVVPSWMIDAGYVPTVGSIFGHGNPVMAALPNPFNDTITQTVQPGLQGPAGLRDTVGSMLSPALKVPLELGFNHSFFNSSPGNNVPVIRPDTGQKGAKSTKEQLLEYFANQVPYARQGMNAKMKGNFGGLISQLTGIYAQELTPNQRRGELSRQRNLSRTQLAKAKRDITARLIQAGVQPPQTAAEWDALFAGLQAQQGR